MADDIPLPSELAWGPMHTPHPLIHLAGCPPITQAYPLQLDMTPSAARHANLVRQFCIAAFMKALRTNSTTSEIILDVLIEQLNSQ